MLKELGFIGIFKINPLIIGMLLMFSTALLAVFVERALYFMSYARWNQEFWTRLKSAVQAGRVHDARTICAQNKNIFAQVFYSVLNSTHLSRTDNEDMTQIVKENMLDKLRAKLGVMSTLSFISPLVGLLGTVTGIMQAFHDLGLSGSGGANIVAAGISEALVATAGGILVAVPAAIFYNYFTYRVRSIGVSMNNHSNELIILIYGGEEAGKHHKGSELRAKVV